MSYDTKIFAACLPPSFWIDDHVATRVGALGVLPFRPQTHQPQLGFADGRLGLFARRYARFTDSRRSRRAESHVGSSRANFDQTRCRWQSALRGLRICQLIAPGGGWGSEQVDHRGQVGCCNARGDESGTGAQVLPCNLPPIRTPSWDKPPRTFLRPTGPQSSWTQRSSSPCRHGTFRTRVSPLAYSRASSRIERLLRLARNAWL